MTSYDKNLLLKIDVENLLSPNNIKEISHQLTETFWQEKCYMDFTPAKPKDVSWYDYYIANSYLSKIANIYLYLADIHKKSNEPIRAIEYYENALFCLGRSASGKVIYFYGVTTCKKFIKMIAEDLESATTTDLINFHRLLEMKLGGEALDDIQLTPRTTE